ncbi:MAG: chemotaxis protein CheX [Bdellovibrionales bacterium]|nr:chemotaxis protein CheX [Bdellovibrionales bacterium]
MEFIRNIMVVDRSSTDALGIKGKILEKSNKFNVFLLDSRLKVAEVFSKNEIRFLFLNSNVGKKDAKYILRFFSMFQEKEKTEIPIFFASEDYELLQEVLKEFPRIKIQIMHTPLDLNDVAEKIYISAFGEASNGSAKAKSKNSDMNVDLEFMNVFISNTRRIISEMAQIPDLVHSPPMLMSQVKEPLHIAISSKILISSVYFKGSYYIAFPKETFFNFYEKVVMERCTEINNENKDFVGELANIIYGQCKKKFSDLGLNLDMVIPSTHLGDINYPVVVLIPFDSPLGKFYLAVAPGLI